MQGGIDKAGSDVFDFTQNDIERLIAAMEPQILQAFLDAVIIAQNQNTLAELADLAASGRLMEVLEQASTAGGQSLAEAINSAFVQSGQTTAAGMTTAFAQIVAFDQTNFRAVQIMTQNKLRLVSEFVNEQRIATREALIDGVRRGINPREMARAFRNSIGLTGRQELSVQNFRRLLETGSSEALQRQLRDRRFDSTVRRAVRGEIILTSAQIDKMTNRYRERMLKYRSEVIARTEALRAVHEGTEEALRQAMDSGVIEADTLQREWHTARDARVRDTHSTMNGQKKLIGEAFISGAGNRLRFPGDINAPASETIQCRCAVSTRVQRLVRRAA